MTDPVRLVLSALAGMGCGLFFFGGLWWTVQRGLSSNVPAPWFLGSLLIRTGAVVTAFLWIGGADWQRMLACLSGFFAMRCIVQLAGSARWI